MKIKIAPFLAALLLMTGTCGCSSSGNTVSAGSKVQNNTLKIAYDSSEYGEDWIKQAAASFKSEVSGTQIVLVPEKNMDDFMSTAFSSGNNLPDLAVMTATNWQYYARKGWLMKLDGVYKAEENGKTLAQKLQSGLKDYGKYNGSYYVVPLSVGIGGILYNASLFEQNGWKEPTTFSQLQDLMEAMKEKGVVPFAWAGKSPGLWNNVFLGWWAKYEGKKGVAEFFDMKSPKVYKQKGRLLALQQFETIVSERSNYLSGAATMDESTMMAAFFKGKAAMVPCDSSFAARYEKLKPAGVEMKMMRLPVSEDAADPDLTAVFVQDFLCIPAQTANAALAQKFLEYLTTWQSAYSFEETAMAPSALDIHFTVSGGFAGSVSDLYEKTDKTYLYSKKAIYYNDLLDWPYSGKPYLQISSGAETALSIINKNYEYAKTAWNSYTK